MLHCTLRNLELQKSLLADFTARIRPTRSYSDLLVTQQQPELGPQSHTRFSQHPFLPSFLIFLKKGACGMTEINFQCHVYQKATTLSKYLACPRVLFSKFLKTDQVPQCALGQSLSYRNSSVRSPAVLYPEPPPPPWLLGCQPSIITLRGGRQGLASVSSSILYLYSMICYL